MGVGVKCGGRTAPCPQPPVSIPHNLNTTSKSIIYIRSPPRTPRWAAPSSGRRGCSSRRAYGTAHMTRWVLRFVLVWIVLGWIVIG